MSTSSKSVLMPTAKSNGNMPKGAAKSPGRGTRGDGSGSNSPGRPPKTSPPKR